MTTFVPKLRLIIPLTDEQVEKLNAAKIEFGYIKCDAPFFKKPGTRFIDTDNSLCPSAWTPAQLRLMADVLESNPTLSLFRDGSGSRLDDPADTKTDYDLPNEV